MGQSSAFVSTDILSTIQSFKISVLLVDDQMIIAEAVKKMLSDQTDIVFHYCADPGKALSIAEAIKPTVILQDLVMPEVDGLVLVKYFRANPATQNIPIVVLSSKEEAQTKADAFAAGANDYLVKLPDKLELIARIRYHSNAYIRLLERNEAFKKLQESQKFLQEELAEAAAYVRSLLPLVLHEEIKTDWRFIPSTQLGGDAFGYHWIDDRYFAMYLLDVCGHGVGAALLSISVLNVLRFQNLPKADFYDPSSVLKALNSAFQMERHNEMFFTIWYGIYDKQNREIIYSNGGHPPAILISGKSLEQSQVHQLTVPGIAIGTIPEAEFQNGVFSLEQYNTLFIFSDGVYEVTRKDASMLTLKEFIELLNKTLLQGKYQLDDIVEVIQDIQGKKIFPDDFSLLEINF